MTLIEEAVAEACQDIAEGTDILAGIETETEDTKKRKRDTSIFAGTDSGTQLQLVVKNESADGVYKHIWIPGYNNPLLPNTTVNEEWNQEIQVKRRKSVNCTTRTAS